jgi:hypothetical protein
MSAYFFVDVEAGVEVFSLWRFIWQRKNIFYPFINLFLYIGITTPTFCFLIIKTSYFIVLIL